MYKKLFTSDILFTGYYGHLNVGDDAFIEVASWGAKKYWNKKNCRFLANPKNLPITINKANGYPLGVPKSYRLQNRMLLPSTNYLISAGGSTINKEISANSIKKMAINKKRYYPKLKVGAIGVSVGPFKTIRDETSTINYLKAIDFIAVRDRASFNFLKSIDLPYKPINSFDLAALLPKIYGIKDKKVELNSRKIVGISVCPYESIVDIESIQKEKSRNNRLVELIKALEKKDNLHFKFLVFNGHSKHGDLDLTKETIKKVSPKSYEIINYTKETRIMWEAVAACDFIITTRLHAAVFACFSDTPFVLNEYHRKCGDFLENIGYDNSLRLYNDEYSIEEKANSIIGILNDTQKYVKPTHKEEMEKLAELNFTEFDI